MFGEFLKENYKYIIPTILGLVALTLTILSFLSHRNGNGWSLDPRDHRPSQPTPDPRNEMGAGVQFEDPANNGMVGGLPLEDSFGGSPADESYEVAPYGEPSDLGF
jgi:hypothetical protein